MLPVWAESVSHTDTVGTDEGVCPCSLVAIRTFDTAPCYRTCLLACQAFCINVRKQSSYRDDKRCPALVGLYCFQPVLSGKHFPCKSVITILQYMNINRNEPGCPEDVLRPATHCVDDKHRSCWCPTPCNILPERDQLVDGEGLYSIPSSSPFSSLFYQT